MSDATGADELTWEHGPSDPACLADGPGTSVEIRIEAPPHAVWPFVVDISFGAQFSTEFLGARWADGVNGPAVGAEFIGTNTHPAIGTWEVPCFVTDYVEHAVFAWCTSDAANPGARWRFELLPDGGSTLLRYSVRLGPGPSGISMAITAMPEKEPRILARRVGEHRVNMQRVIDGIALAATSTSSPL